MTSRDRLKSALSHRQPDRIPLDLGSTGVTGMHCGSVAAASATVSRNARSGSGSRCNCSHLDEIWAGLGVTWRRLRLLHDIRVSTSTGSPNPGRTGGPVSRHFNTTGRRGQRTSIQRRYDGSAKRQDAMAVGTDAIAWR
jgi:hypothetical protein